MPFEISIKIISPVGRAKETLRVAGHNGWPPDGDRENPVRIYRYSAEDLEISQVTDGEVLHLRNEGMAKLASIILQDDEKKKPYARHL